VYHQAIYTYHYKLPPSTYDHRIVRTALPVRSAVLNHYAGTLVVGSVTTSESALLYVFDFCFQYATVNYDLFIF
jgi:hypothetical protein